MCNKLLNLINAKGVQQTILEHNSSKRDLVIFRLLLIIIVYVCFRTCRHNAIQIHVIQ